MFTTIKNTVLFLFPIFFLTVSLYAQYIPSDERGDASIEKKSAD